MPASTVVGRLKDAGGFLWEMLTEFIADNCPQMAAALSYYTVFSLPPLLILLIIMIEPFLDPQTVTQMVQQQVGGLLGSEGASQVETMIQNVRRPGTGGPLATGLSIGAFIVGATVAFAQLQFALNTAWEVAPDPTRGDIKNFLLKRVLSFAMILTIGFLLLVSLVLSAVLAAFGDILAAMAPGAISAVLLQGINYLVGLTVITLLFAAMYEYLPDAVVARRDALVGGLVTALLFNLGRFLIGLYLGQSDPGSVYGAAGSLAVVLVWIYYSSMILLLGAEFTQVWAKRRGFPIMPVPGAVRILRTQERIEPKKKGAKVPKSPAEAASAEAPVQVEREVVVQPPEASELEPDAQEAAVPRQE
ncbi:MAG TPA: YihY/virulence factor BrkB family protein [Longimicrobiaceae bacterium]|nr:YihY/virulence factor BrkB family protein [Longimicrobiaceae bacterium]